MHAPLDATFQMLDDRYCGVGSLLAAASALGRHNGGGELFVSCDGVH